MKDKRHLTEIHVLLIISVLMSGFVPLQAQAALQVQANDPPYVIRGHVYEYDTRSGLAGARVQVQFEACDGATRYVRTVTLPSTDSSGAWEFDEANYAHPPCLGTTFTITQRILPAGYIAVRTQTPADPAPVRGDTIVLTPPTSGTYDGNIFFDRHPYILRGHVIDDDTEAGVAGVEIAFDTLRGTFTTTTTTAGLWEFDESQVLAVSTYLSNYSTNFFVDVAVPAGYWAADATVHAAGTVISATELSFPDVTPSTYDSNEFHIAEEKDLEVTNTEHFSIEWCSDPSSPDYPEGARGGKRGFDYIQLLGESLEQAWDTYEGLDYDMPPATPGRSDDRILVHVQAVVDLCGFIKFETGGFAVMGQIWTSNDHPTDGGLNSSFLATNAAHEFFHLVQQANYYPGYEGIAGCDDLRILDFLRIAQTRDNWLGESTAMWAQKHVVPGDSDYDDYINKFYDDLYHPLPYGVFFPTNLRVYGAVVFPLFLEEHPGAAAYSRPADIIRDMWTEISKDPDHPFAAIDTVLAAHPSPEIAGMDDAFVHFSTANYLFDDPTVGYDDGSNWGDVAALRLMLVPPEREHSPEMRESKLGSGMAYALGTSYARVDSANLPPFDPDEGNLLRIDLTAWEELYPAELDVDDLKVQLLTITPRGPGGCAAGETHIIGDRCLEVTDVTDQMETSWLDGRTWWILETAVEGLGSDWEEIAIVVVNSLATARLPDAGLPICSSPA